MTKIEKPSRVTLIKAADIIKNGGLVAFPTETVYGLGASAYNARAVAKIFEVKKRPFFDPVIVHISKIERLYDLCLEVDDRAVILAQRFWPGPLTLVLPKSSAVPDIVVAGLYTVAIRMPANHIALELIENAGVPIAAPSANLFGRLSPTTAEHVAEQIGEKIDLIIDGGRTDLGIESTVLDLTGEPMILRPGGLPVEEIEQVIGQVKFHTTNKIPHSPGQLPKHYAPRIPLKIIKNGNFSISEGLDAGLLVLKEPPKYHSFKVVEVLSPDGDLQEAACNLFSALHRLEKEDIDIIYAEPVPEIGLGRAIMDRLRKAEGESLDRSDWNNVSAM